jgi:hypothetical protein
VILGHSFFAAVALLLSTVFVVASLRKRLPPVCWPVVVAGGTGALLVPAGIAHYAEDRWDLAAMAALSVAAFVSLAHASRTRIAQLPPWWSATVDQEAGRLDR